MSYFFYLNITDILSLTVEPHLDPLAVYFSFNPIGPVFFAQDFSRRQAVQYGIDITARIGERHALQRAPIHELDALAEFPFLKPPVVRNAEKVLFYRQIFDPIQAVNSRRHITGAFIDFLNLTIVYEGDEIEIILRKEQRQRLQTPFDNLPILYPAIGNRNVAMLLDGLAKLPHRV